jgi:hypothetical protein
VRGAALHGGRGAGGPAALRLAAVAGALIAASTALGYERTTGEGGRCLWWDARVVPYALRGAGGNAADPACRAEGDARAAIRAAFDGWAGASRTGAARSCTDLRFEDRGAAPAAAEGAGLVTWRGRPCRSPLVPDDDPCHAEGRCGERYDCWDHGPYYVAVTAVRYRSQTGEISGGEIELNGWTGQPGAEGFYFTCVTPEAGAARTCSAPGEDACVYADVQTVVTHEAGHLLGFAHVADRASVMFHSVEVGEVRRVLTADDVEGVCTAYPAGGRTATCLPGGGCAGGPSSGGSLLLAALAALAVRTRGGAVRRRPGRG